jgi:hypothetical protein
MIIVEGCDNAGKTTLVQKLSDELRLLTVLNRRRPKTLLESWDYLYAIMPAVKLLPTVMDRFMAVSEPIYGPICRKEALYTPMDIRQQFDYVQRFLKRPPLLIYCRPSRERILDFGDRPQMAGVIDNADNLIGAYDLRMTWLRNELVLPVVRYDYEQRGAYDEVLSVAQAHLKDLY